MSWLEKYVIKNGGNYIKNYYTKVVLTGFWILVFNLSCKTISSEAKVSNGIETIGFPGVVLIRMDYGDDTFSNCTASIVSHNTLLTAAHCLIKVKSPDAVTVYYGDGKTARSKNLGYNKDFKYEGGKVDESIVFDIGVVVFEDNTFSEITQYKIANYNLQPGYTIRIVGYGCKTYVASLKGVGKYYACDDTESPVKRYGTNVVTKNEYCKKEMIEIRSTRSQADKDIDKPTGIDVYTFQGDSGGPMFYYKDTRIVGIASYGNHGWTKEHDHTASCFTDVTHPSNIDFLKRVTSKIGAVIQGLDSN